MNRRLGITAAVAWVLAGLLAVVVLRPVHLRVTTGGPVPAAVGQPLVVTPVDHETLDCGSLLVPGPAYTSEGGDCADLFGSRDLVAVTVVIMLALAAVGAGAVGALFVVRARVSRRVQRG